MFKVESSAMQLERRRETPTLYHVMAKLSRKKGNQYEKKTNDAQSGEVYKRNLGTISAIVREAGALPGRISREVGGVRADPAQNNERIGRRHLLTYA